jgi:hypothetical protein
MSTGSALEIILFHYALTLIWIEDATRILTSKYETGKK